MNILVIDDEDGLRRSLCAYLEDLGYDALDAPNGLDGLKVMRENLEGLVAVIVDLNMPVLDGYGFLRRPGRRPRSCPSSCSRASAWSTTPCRPCASGPGTS